MSLQKTSLVVSKRPVFFPLTPVLYLYRNLAEMVDTVKAAEYVEKACSDNVGEGQDSTEHGYNGEEAAGRQCSTLFKAQCKLYTYHETTAAVMYVIAMKYDRVVILYYCIAITVCC